MIAVSIFGVMLSAAGFLLLIAVAAPWWLIALVAIVVALNFVGLAWILEIHRHHLMGGRQ